MKIKKSCSSAEKLCYGTLSVGTVYRTIEGALRVKVVFPSASSYAYCVDPLTGTGYRHDWDPEQFEVKEVFPQATLVLED